MVREVKISNSEEKDLLFWVCCLDRFAGRNRNGLEGLSRESGKKKGVNFAPCLVWSGEWFQFDHSVTTEPAPAVLEGLGSADTAATTARLVLSKLHRAPVVRAKLFMWLP